VAVLLGGVGGGSGGELVGGGVGVGGGDHSRFSQSLITSPSSRLGLSTSLEVETLDTVDNSVQQCLNYSYYIEMHLLVTFIYCDIFIL